MSEQESAKLLFQILGVYFIVGIVCLAQLELSTRRISEGFNSVAFQIASLLQTGERVSQVLALGVIFVFWPAAVYGALERWWKDNHTTEEKNDKTGKEN